jgi:hypothetical protein
MCSKSRFCSGVAARNVASRLGEELQGRENADQIQSGLTEPEVNLAWNFGIATIDHSFLCKLIVSTYLRILGEAPEACSRLKLQKV